MQNNDIVKPNSNDTKVLGFGIAVLVIVFGVLMGWMAMAPLSTSVVGNGKVSVDYNKKTVQHLEGGTIEQILIKDGDFVKQDDPLIVLDDTQLRIAINAENEQYLQAKAAIARLQAQKKRETDIDFPKELRKHEDIKKDQQNILNSKVSSIKAQEIITQQKIQQLNQQISQQKESIQSTQAQLLSIQEELADQQELVKQNLVDRQRLRDLQREEIKLKNELVASELEIRKLRNQIDEVQSTLELKRKEFDNEIDAKLVEQKARANEAKAQVEAQSDKLAKTIIKAPSTGYVTGLDIHTEGGVVPASEPILDIVPKDSDLFVIAEVATQDIDKLHKGLKADIRFSAFDMMQTYVVEGKVTNISADSIEPKRENQQPYYEVKLELTQAGRKQMHENGFVLQPGMPADVMISVGTRTTLSYLVKPFTDMLAKSFNEE